MMAPNDLIAAGYRMAKGLIHRMVDDLSPEDFLHQPCPGANTAAWVVGHLAVSLRRTADRLGASDLPSLDPGLVTVLTQTGKPAGEQTGLGDPAALVRLFDECADRVIDVVGRVEAESLSRPPAQAGTLATNYGEALLFGALHVAVHSGQLSTIRRSLGKPPIV
jgi:uncharacterized damage-inducible protein DinB